LEASGHHVISADAKDLLLYIATTAVVVNLASRTAHMTDDTLRNL